MESHINEQRLFQSFRELVSIDSPSFSERNMADSLKQRLVKIGFSVEEDDVAEKIGGNSGNLFAVLPGQLDAPPLLLCGHMDTVAPAVGKQAILEPDGRIHSAGDTILGADDLSAICAILEAVTSLEEQGIPHRPIEVLFTVAEETYGDGVLNFDFRKIQAKEAYVLDYDGPIGSAAIAAPTILMFQVTVNGKSSHAGFAPEKGISAICAAAAAISKIPNGRVAPNATLNFSRIEGGLLTNIVPETCLVKGEIRSTDHPYAMQLLANLEEIFRQVCAEVGAEVEITHRCMIHAYATPEDSPVVQRYLRVCRSLGLETELVTTFGGSDNNVLALHGISGIVAASAMHACHTCSEYTTLREMTQVARIVAGLLCTTD